MTMGEKDRQEIREQVDRELPAHRVEWLIFRRGSQNRPIRLVLATAKETRARDRFETLRLVMRQGSLYLVDPKGKIVDYAGYPMVRTRW